MKVKTLIPFIVILVVLAGLVVWQKVNVKPQVSIATQIGLQTLVPEGLQKDSIKRLEMFAGEKPEEKVILERDGDNWRIDSLYNAPGNAETINKFLDDLLGLRGEPRATGDTEEKLASFALTDKEAFHIQAFKADEESPVVDVLFGKSADFRTVFLRKAGDSKVFVEAANLRRDAGVSDTDEGATPKQEKWLQTKLLELQDKGITKLALNYPDKELVLTREEVPVEPKPQEGEAEGEAAPAPKPEPTYKWVLSQGGFTKEINEQEVKTLLTRFANLAVTNVADPARKAELGFEQPLFSLTISREEGDDIVLLGGKDKPGGDTYIQRVGSTPELIYQISKYNFEQIFLQGSKLFALPEWSLDKAALRAIQVAGPQGTMALAYSENAWKVTEPQLSLEVQKTALDNLVAAMASLKPVDYADAGKDVGAFDTTITATLEGGATRTLHIGQPSLNLDGRYVKFDDSDAVLVLSRSDVEKLMPPVRDLFVLSVLDFDVEKVKGLHATGEGADLSLARAEGSTAWTGTFNGAEIAPDPAKVDELIYSINDFQVDNFLLDRAVDSVQAASTVTVTLADGTETVVKVSAEKDGVFELAISGLPYVFTAGLGSLTGIIDKISAFATMTPPAPVEAAPAAEAAPVSDAAAIPVAAPAVPEAVPPSEPTAIVVPETTPAVTPAGTTDAAPAAPVVVMPQTTEAPKEVPAQ